MQRPAKTEIQKKYVFVRSAQCSIDWIPIYLSQKSLSWAFLIYFDETRCRKHDANGHANGRSNQTDDQFDGWNQNANYERSQHNRYGNVLKTMFGNVMRYLGMWLQVEVKFIRKSNMKFDSVALDSLDDKSTSTNSLCMGRWPVESWMRPTARNPIWWFRWSMTAKSWAEYCPRNADHCMPHSRRHRPKYRLLCKYWWPLSQFDSFSPATDSAEIRTLRTLVFGMRATCRKSASIAKCQMVATSGYYRSNNWMLSSPRNRKQSETIL